MIVLMIKEGQGHSTLYFKKLNRGMNTKVTISLNKNRFSRLSRKSIFFICPPELDRWDGSRTTKVSKWATEKEDPINHRPVLVSRANLSILYQLKSIRDLSIRNLL
jgi:hypothetical protein